MRLNWSLLRAGAVVGVLSLLATPGVAHAYLGPGLGLGTIGVVLGVIGSIFLGILSVLWYPVKRLIRRLRRAGKPPSAVPPPPPISGPADGD